jgi:hypothetical protein
VLRKFELREPKPGQPRLRGLRVPKLSFLAALASFLVSSVPAHAQDVQPSVADAARQARKDKDKMKDKDAAAPKTVITEDSISAGGASGVVAPSLAAPDLSGKSGSTDSPWAKLRATEVALDRLASLDRAQLSQIVLKSTEDFPGRHDWENKLFSAKVTYVNRSRQLIEAMKQVLTDMEALQSEGQGKIDPNDPRAQELAGRAQQVVKLTNGTESAFQGIMAEGQALARQAQPAQPR